MPVEIDGQVHQVCRAEEEEERKKNKQKSVSDEMTFAYFCLFMRKKQAFDEEMSYVFFSLDLCDKKTTCR